MNTLATYQTLIEKEIKALLFDRKTPKEIYDPIHYILSLKGKRIRPIFCLLACDLFGGDLKKALKPALALELFHHFTLLHDDLMDKSPLRRGQKSVHEKFSANQAILSGDLLFGLSYQFFESLVPNIFYEVVNEFTKMAIKVCEGQQMDMNLEAGLDFVFEDYLQMIYGKTATLLATSFKIGALIAEVSDKKAALIYEMGKNLGLAFQIQDDYLDVFGDKNTGKIQGGDLYRGKKTILYFEALEKANKKQKEDLLKFYSLETKTKEEISYLKELFESLNIAKAIQKRIQFYKDKALQNLKVLEGQKTKEMLLRKIIEELASRTS